MKPDHTAVRTALWRALHVELDEKPSVFTDEIGAQIAGEENWRSRPDMAPDFSKSMRASIVTRARFVEDLVLETKAEQYVILGAGLDTFAQRHPMTSMQVFEIDQPGPQMWKQQRLKDIGRSKPAWLHFVPVDFESGESWWDKLIERGFEPRKQTIVVSTGVSMYLTRETNQKTLEQVAKLAKGSVFAMTFMLALELLEPKERSLMEFVMSRALESGTPFHSLFTPDEIVQRAKQAGFVTADYVSAKDLFNKYLAGRGDGLNAGSAEAFLVAKT